MTPPGGKAQVVGPKLASEVNAEQRWRCMNTCRDGHPACERDRRSTKPGVVCTEACVAQCR